MIDYTAIAMHPTPIVVRRVGKVGILTHLGWIRPECRRRVEAARILHVPQRQIKLAPQYPVVLSARPGLDHLAEDIGEGFIESA
jgi:hypothetical protein